MFAALHSKITVDDLLHGMIVQSGNDACIVAGRGHRRQRSRFRRHDDTSARARSACQIDIHQFERACPIPTQQVTARELAKLARYIILDYPDLYKILRRARLHLEQDPPAEPQSAARREIGADGLKTGFTKEAGYGLVGSAVQNGLRLIVVVNGAKDRQGARRRSARSCSNGASAASRSAHLFAEGEIVG